MSEAPRDEAFETRAIHSGRDFVGETGAVVPPVWLTSTFEYGNPGGFDYTRSGNPNFALLDRTVASLEGGAHATCFGSGVSAITAVVSTLASGDLVLAEENLYGCTFRLFEQVFAKFGLEVRYLDFTDPASLEAIATLRGEGGRSPALVWIESPTNPNLKVIDIAAVASAAKAAGAPLLVDNTFASSYLQRPLELGADLSLVSLTKYTNGHSDALAGAVCTNDAGWHGKMVFAQKALGLQPAPMDCWLTLRGAKTESLRMERHCANALRFAEWLEAESGARWVRYPYLPSHPQYEIARRQMSGGSGMVTADLGLSLEETIRFLDRLRYFPRAESLGGVESLCCHPATMTHASVPRERREAVGITDSLVRFSVGIEGVEDLIADVREALDRVA